MNADQINSTGKAWNWFVFSLEQEYSQNEIQALGREVFSHFFGLAPADRVMGRDNSFAPQQIKKLGSVIQQLKNHVPVQYITGKAHFFGLDFFVNENVLIPRPETEELVQWVLKSVAEKVKDSVTGLTMLDAGTGSGCIAIALATKLSKSRIMACDISEPALETARINAKKNNVNIDFFNCDILGETPDISGLDVVVSNPPYIRQSEKTLIPPNVLNFEPHSALFVSDHDPLVFYRHIAQKAFQWLRHEGLLFFEINENLGTETMNCVENEGFYLVQLKQDINGKARMIKAVKASR